jgi:hypothetical protein
MTDTKYAPPLDKLLTLGESDLRTSVDWSDYLALGIGPEHIPDLLRMVNDEELNDLESDRPEVWAPVHAVRALGQLRDESTIHPLLQILTSHEDDEWIREDIPHVFGLIGPAAIPGLSDYLADALHEMYARSYAAGALQVIAERYAEYRSSCIEGITRTLERFEENDEELNAFIIDDLAELKAVDTLPLIEKAYEAGMVDESILDLDYVLVLMGLKEPKPEDETATAFLEHVRNFYRNPTYKLSPSDIEIVPPDFSDAENAPIVDSLPGQASKPVRNFESIKFSRNKPKKKKKKRH